MEAPALIHREMELTTGLIRDLFTADIDRLVIDSKEVYKQVLDYLKAFSPELKSRIKVYKGDGPIFDEYGIEAGIEAEIEAEIEKSLERKVWLKKGGYIVIDFIDMEMESSRKQVAELLRNEVRRDRSRTKVYSISELGLVEMTRQRERPSLVHLFSEDCPTCGGVGKVLSQNSVMMRIERFLRRVAAHSKEKTIQLRLHPDSAAVLFDNRSERFEELEKQLDLRIDVREDPRLRRDDIRLVFPRMHKDVTAEFTA